MAYQIFLREYMHIPLVTRVYMTACVVTTLAVQLDLVSPLQLYFNPILILKKFQLWRMITAFLYFGNLGLHFFYNVMFTYQFCRMLEEGSFDGKTADFVVMFMFGGILMILCAFFVNLLFFGQAFTFMIVYVWSRRSISLSIEYFGIMDFQAAYLPWVLLGFSVLLGNAVYVELVGIAIGHFYFFLEDVLPRQRGGQKILKTPKFLQKLFDSLPGEYGPLPEEFGNVRPGGFE